MFRRRGCKAGRMRCKYDPITHRCVCGNWERGFKPKTEPKSPRAECQICEAKFALHNGRMVHHGYKRPGCGFIVGDCMGVGHAPYPATDALVLYLASVKGYLGGRKHARKHTKAAKELTYTYTKYKGWGDRETVHVTLAEGYGGGFMREAHGNHYFPSFEEEKASALRRIDHDIESAKREIERVEKRIANAAK